MLRTRTPLRHPMHVRDSILDVEACCSPDMRCAQWQMSNVALTAMPMVQVYAYTVSELQVAILKLFVRAECRLPNLFVGTLTRESVTQALEFGVQADQIITFMQQHAHPHVLHKVPVVPEVQWQPFRVCDQDVS